MGTRSCIARKTETGFKGVYHHSDGGPFWMGRYLFRTCRDQFAGRWRAMLKIIIDDHPAGWSNFIDMDLTLPAAFRNIYSSADLEDKHPICYCCGKNRQRKAAPLDEWNAEEANCEWAYVFDRRRPIMQILIPVGHDTSKWECVADLRLDDEEPDWEAIAAFAKTAPAG